MADPLTIAFHGAAHTVTGSCMEFNAGSSRILVDCGMFQGSRSLETLNFRPFDFDPQKVDAVILTHAHIDHCGLLPRLVKEGYSGKIWCTPETRDLLEYMLTDSGRIQEYEAQRRNHRRDRAGEEPVAPIYTESDALDACAQCHPIRLEEWFEPAPGFRARLWNAGHILGSASVELEAQGVRVMCSGDLGPEHKAFEHDPEGPRGFDHVISESTYGDERRKQVTIEQRRELLEKEIKDALAQGGNLIIPSFALERTQELLLDIAILSSQGKLPMVQTFVDSPLATRATRVFEKYIHELEDVGKVPVFTYPTIHYVQDALESMRLNSVSGAIILAASGMCEAGRIRHHLKHNLHRRDSTILFVGFQAQGTLGRVILDGAKRVRISGNDINVRARIRRIGSYSAHADQAELLAWIKARGPISGSLFLGHGEASASEELGRLADEGHLAPKVILPDISESYELLAGEPAHRLHTASDDIRNLLGRDWQNSYADFATNLKGKLAKIEDETARQKAIEEMRRILDSYAKSHQGAKQHHGHGH